MASFLSNNTYRIGRVAHKAGLSRGCKEMRFQRGSKWTKVKLGDDYRAGWDDGFMPRRFNDQLALDLIALILASPEWDTSYIEDIAEIVKRSGRPDVSMLVFDDEEFEWPGH